MIGEHIHIRHLTMGANQAPMATPYLQQHINHHTSEGALHALQHKQILLCCSLSLYPVGALQCCACALSCNCCFEASGSAALEADAPVSMLLAPHLLHTACGIISPNTNIAVTLSRIAANGFSSLSKNSGRASMHAALHNSSVHSSQWGFATKPMSLVAALRCFGAPATFRTCRR